MTPADADPPLDLQSCESEPIHVPGLIQPHGVLLALDETSYVIEQVSANSERLLGVAPGDLIGSSLARILGEREFAQLKAALTERPLETGIADVAAGALHEAMECVAVRYRGALIVELEPSAGAHSLDLLDVSLSLQAPLARMERTSSVVELARTVAMEIREISGFDRVMVYRFDEDWHGEMIAEEVGDRFPVSYLGLHFPASDIPAQARELYLLNTLRLIPDVEYIPVPIVPQENPRLHAPLDLSRSYLRSVSPIHLEYLRNIGVRATLTISLVVHGKLWGNIACHHATPRRLNRQVRSTCHFFARMLGLKLTSRIDQAELSGRLNASRRIVRFVSDLESTQSLWDALHGNWPALLRIFGADALFVRGPEGTALYGSALAPNELRPVLDRLQETAKDGLANSPALYQLCPEAKRFSPGLSGALYIGLSAEDDDCLVLFRREESATVKWAGDPHKPATAAPGTGRLSPRASFEAWEEIKRCESSHWSANDLEKAALLRAQLIVWQQARQEVRLLGLYDPLTELPNRRLLDELLKRALNEAEARSTLVGLLFIDIDRFRRFNDRLGRAVGDRVLRDVAARISRAVREGDIAGRLGGDEFVVIMPALLDRSVAEDTAQRLFDEISQPMDGLEGPDLRVTLSIGISLFPADGTTGETLLSKADADMYRVKEHARDAFAAYESAKDGAPGGSLELAKSVAAALDRGEIIAHFQPVVSLADGRVVAVEALARWNHPVSGLLGPAAFIEVAEESDLIVRLGETMLDQACRQVCRWRRTSAPDLRVAVNVSPRQLRNFGFVKSVREILGRYRLPPEALELEITESMLAGNTSQSINALRELADSGIRITIDDFGIGYSSFNYLRTLPVQALKIDQSFVAELGVPDTIDSGSAIVRAIVSAAASLGLEVVAEGVETRAQLELLRSFRCNYAQGYYIGRPLTAAAYATFSRVQASEILGASAVIASGDRL